MKLFNVTDCETDTLLRHGLVDQTIAVDGDLVTPGSSKDIADADKARIDAEYAHLLGVGALSWQAKKVRNAVVKLPADVVVSDTTETTKVEGAKKSKG